VAQGENEADWCRRVAELAVDMLVRTNIVGKADFDRASAIVAEEIGVRLSLEDRPNNERSVIGYYVRVTTTQVVDGEPLTVLYVVGYPTPREAEQAVRKARSQPSEKYEVLAGEVAPGRGPQPKPGQVWELKGAK
jgi:hypothetical protein